MIDFSIRELVEMNFKLEHAYQKIAEKADAANHFSNGFLLTSAVGVALGEIGGASSKAIERQIALILGVNQGFKYANPSQVARAYRKASREALCMSQTTVAKGTTSKKAFQYQAANEDYADRVKMIYAMRLSYTNLRERLTRSPVGFLNILNNIREQKDILEREDKITIENKLAIANASTDKDEYSVRLLSCLN